MSLRGRCDFLGSCGSVGFPRSKGTSTEELGVINNGHQARKAEKQKEEESSGTQQKAAVQFVELLYARNQGHQRLLRRWATAYLKPSTSVCLSVALIYYMLEAI